MEHILASLSGLMGIVWAIIALGILIFAHELGHFLVAKLSGVGVVKFSLGFGRKIVGWQVGETEYLISALPLGGYVKMVGEDEDGEELSEADKARSFGHQPVAKRLAIVFAGPLFNILLAVVLCYVVLVTGEPTPVAKVVGVGAGTPAASAGFVAGDIITKLDGEPVSFIFQVDSYLEEHAGKRVEFGVMRGGNDIALTAVAPAKAAVKEFGLYGSAVVAAVKEKSPSDMAGIRMDDRIISVDGVAIGSWEQMAEIIRVSPGKNLRFVIERKGGMMGMDITPEAMDNPDKPGENIGVIGVIRGVDQMDIAHGPLESAGLSLDRTYRMTGMIVGFLAKIVKGEEKASNVGGPISIVKLSDRQAKRGFGEFVTFMALLSVNLGVINLVPIPILDGGVLFFLLLEAVMGRPLSMRQREIAQQVGLFLLVSLMVFVFGLDIARWMGLVENWK